MTEDGRWDAPRQRSPTAIISDGLRPRKESRWLASPCVATPRERLSVPRKSYNSPQYGDFSC
ncbi:hypothetical protein PLANPX_0999 [Lacipirellula parvula]|uniref:Uncharacterized protein n=1 Tax=Lacipirellula parvula TaxID=2650471 RepID=A0A5K7X6B5_9BACT|nr:hypothetical protein PLANPX_0999 [Lacipirellula parvula]